MHLRDKVHFGKTGYILSIISTCFKRVIFEYSPVLDRLRLCKNMITNKKPYTFSLDYAFDVSTDLPLLLCLNYIKNFISTLY